MGFETAAQADQKCAEVLTILGAAWKGRVWENLGWHCAWQNGAVTLYYDPRADYFHALIGEPWGCGGHIDLHNKTEYEYSNDPKEVIKKACDSALEAIQQNWKPIELSVSIVRLSLGAE